MPKNSLYLSKTALDLAEKGAERKGISKSAFIATALSSLGIENEAIKPAILQVPIHLTSNNEDGLRAWLMQRTEGIVKHYYPN